MVGAFIMQGSKEMYRFDIKEISKEAALEMIQKYHYSNTLPKTNKYFMVGRHNSQDVPTGTLKSIKNDSGIE